MKYFWYAGRLLIVSLFVTATVFFMGSMEPATLSVSELVGEFQEQESEVKQSEELPKAEDLVKDWPKPEFVLFVTGRQHGYIEPCGCITLERQKGGMMRRHAVKKIIEGRGWSTIAIDAGNQVRRIGIQPEVKFQKTYEALWQKMKYDVIGFGPDDMKLGAIQIVQRMINNRQEANLAQGIPKKNPYTCANVGIHGMNESFQIIQRGNKRIGVTHVMGDEHLDSIQQAGVTTLPTAKALPKVINAMNQARCDVKVLVAFSSIENCKKIAQNFPHFNVLVTAGGAGDPTLHPEIIKTGNHTTSMIQVGVKGMYVGLVGFFANNQGELSMKYHRAELDHRYKDTPEIKEVFKSYQNEIKRMWLGGHLEGDIRPRPHPSGHKFVGSDTCNDCHDEEYDIWVDGVNGNGFAPHAEATDDLAQNPNDNRVWVQRDFDPECISCHATGWNAQDFYPFESGLLNPDKDVHLRASGCENCHGPGSAHVEIEKLADKGNVDEKLQKKLREEMVLTLAEARDGHCKQCHDLDNSPDFLKEGGFDVYWPKIKHGKPKEKKGK